MAEFGAGQAIIPGGLDAITAALQRRRFGDSASPLSQVSGAAPTPNNPNIQAPPITPTPTPSAGTLPTPPAEPGLTPPTGTPNEAELIIKALSNRLNAISKKEAPPGLGGPSPVGGPPPTGGLPPLGV